MKISGGVKIPDKKKTRTMASLLFFLICSDVMIPTCTSKKRHKKHSKARAFDKIKMIV